jgi:2-keto-3-deoxy-L-rhamnonate aldolase RhmA
MKEQLAAGKVVIGAQLRFGSPAIAELFGHAGFDYIVLDAEHAPQTSVGIQHQIQALAATQATPIVRLLKNDPESMRPYLDMGTGGVLVPFVTTGEEARLGARALRYPPVGTRGWGPSRAAKYGFDPYDFATANKNMIYVPVIEDERAVRNIDEILAVEGVDSFLIGPVDLSISLGVPMQYKHRKYRDAIRTVIKAGQVSGKPLGTAVYPDMFNADTYRQFVDQGFTLLMVGGDEWMLTYACRKVMEFAAAIKG